MVCRHATVPGVRVLGQETLRAFGSAYWAMDDVTKLEGPWLSTIFTTAILIIIGVSTLTHKTRPGPSLLRTVVGLYAIFTGLVEVVRLVFDVSRFALVWAAIHNLAEWGIIGHLLWTMDGAKRHWMWSRLWILFVAQGILYLPTLLAAGAWEQLCGIWCDWLLVACFALRFHELRQGDDQHKALANSVFSWGLVGACLHMAEILPLVGLLVGFVKPPFMPFAMLISFSSPITMYIYHRFALAWDEQIEKATGNPDGVAAVEAHRLSPDASPLLHTPIQQGGHMDMHGSGRTNGNAKQSAPAALEPYLEQNTRSTKWLLVYIVCFLLGTATILGPIAMFPHCDAGATMTATAMGTSSPMAALAAAANSSHAAAAASMPAGLAAAGAAVAAAVTATPADTDLCVDRRALVGTTVVNAKPGAEAALYDLLRQMPPGVRKEEGCLQYQLLVNDERSPTSLKYVESWSSMRTLLKHIYMSPTVERTFGPSFRALAANMTMDGPHHPLAPCAGLAGQPQEVEVAVSFGVLDAPLACVWAHMDDWADAGWVSGALRAEVVPGKAFPPGPGGKPFMRRIVTPRCTLTEIRALGQPVAPAPPQPEGGRRLWYHVLDGCMVDAANGALIESYKGEVTLMPTADGKTEMSYRARIMPTQGASAGRVWQAVWDDFQPRIPFVRNWAAAVCKQ